MVNGLARLGVLCVSASAALLAALALPGSANLLRADGGTLRVANVPMGAYRVNVYTDPTPITPDSIDVSVLATFERGRGVALGLEIEVVARLVAPASTDLGQGNRRKEPDERPPVAAHGDKGPQGGAGLHGKEIRRKATRDQAEDPRFYAAKFALGAEGKWEITVAVDGPEGAGEVLFVVEVREAGLFANPYLILVLALLPLGLVAVWFRRTAGPSSPSNHPED